MGKDVEEPYMKEVQRFLDMGKSQEYAKNAAFQRSITSQWTKAKKDILTTIVLDSQYQT